MRKSVYKKEIVGTFEKPSKKIQEEAKRILKRPYSWVLTPEKNGVSAEIIQLPGCVSCGDTLEEALANLKDAATGWVEVHLMYNPEMEIPKPKCRCAPCKCRALKRVRKSK